MTSNNVTISIHTKENLTLHYGGPIDEEKGGGCRWVVRDHNGRGRGLPNRLKKFVRKAPKKKASDG